MTSVTVQLTTAMLPEYDNFNGMYLCQARNEMSMIMWVYDQGKEELLRLEPLCMVMKKGRLRLFGYVKRKDDGDCV